MSEMKSSVDFFLTAPMGTGTEADPWRPALAQGTDHWWCAAANEPTSEVIMATPADSNRVPGFPGSLGEDVTREVVEQKIREEMGMRRALLDPKDPSPSGTFTDDFNDGADGQFLENRTGWTIIAGSTGTGTGRVQNQELQFFDGGAGGGTGYLVPDQGSPDHYSEYVYTGSAADDAGESPVRAAIRMAAVDEIFGIIHASSGLLLNKRQPTGWTLLGTWGVTRTAGELIRLWAEGDSLFVSVNGTTRIGPVNDPYNNTVQRQGLVIRGTGWGSLGPTRRQDTMAFGEVSAATPKRFTLNIANATMPGAPGGSVPIAITGGGQGTGNISQ